jgi:aerobic carbon-monoxide dehydrogenase medium subunit
MKSFEYFAPATLSEACQLLAAHNGEARVIAGGTDLLLKMKAGTLRVAPKAIVNIKRLPELRGISNLQPQISIGALTTLEELRHSPLIREHCPALAEAANTMASVQIRNMATVGGNLCNAAPSGDLAPILIALEALAVISGLSGSRRIPLDEFFIGPGQTALALGELLLSIEVPPPNGCSLYLKRAPREHMDIAVVGVGLSLRLEDGRCISARVVLGAVAPIPMRARRAEAELTGGPLTAERISRAARLAAEEAKPIDDVRSSAWYRLRMVEVLTRRGLTALTQICPDST